MSSHKKRQVNKEAPYFLNYVDDLCPIVCHRIDMEFKKKSSYEMPFLKEEEETLDYIYVSVNVVASDIPSVTNFKPFTVKPLTVQSKTSPEARERRRTLVTVTFVEGGAEQQQQQQLPQPPPPPPPPSSLKPNTKKITKFGLVSRLLVGIKHTSAVGVDRLRVGNSVGLNTGL